MCILCCMRYTWRAERDPLLKRFWTERVEFDSDSWTSSAEMTEAFNRMQRAQNVSGWNSRMFVPASKKLLGDNSSVRYGIRRSPKTGRAVRAWWGARLKSVIDEG